VERYFRHSELEPQAIEEEPVVDGVESRRHQVEAGQDSDLLVIGRLEAPSRTFSRPSAVSVRPLLYADWNWLKLAELSRWGSRRANARVSRDRLASLAMAGANT